MYLQMLRFSLKLIVLYIVSFQLFSHIVEMISKNNLYVKEHPHIYNCFQIRCTLISLS